MATVETVLTSLNGNFKNVYGEKISNLVPQSDILYRNDRFKFVSKQGREGLQYNQPVILSLPTSATWGLNAPTLNNPIAMQMANAVVTGSAITTRDILSYDAAARAASSDAAFEDTLGLVMRTLMQAHSKLCEIDLLYGNGSIASGISLAQSVSVVASGANAAATITYGTWAPALFSGMQNALLDAYQGGTKINTNAGLQIVSINVVPASNTVGGVVTLSGNAADITALKAASGGVAIDFYWYNAYGNNVVGLSGILQNTGTLFGINAASYDLWQSNVFDCQSSQLTFSKLQQAIALAVGRGLDEPVVALVSPVTFADLLNEQAGARMFDESYKPKQLENGWEAIQFWGPSGKIEIVPHMYVHQGEAFVVPPKQVIKVGPMADISPTVPGLKGEIFLQSPTTAAYEIRLFSDFGLLNNMPAKSVYIKNIVNSISA